MIYADYYLKFPDADTAAAVLGPPDAPRYRHVDTLGVLYADQPDPDIPATPLDGWHANVRVVVGVEDPAPLHPYAITPTHPRRLWAGGMFPAPVESQP